MQYNRGILKGSASMRPHGSPQDLEKRRGTPMIEVLPTEEFWKGSYGYGASVVDRKAYCDIYNGFVDDWNRFVKRKRSAAKFLDFFKKQTFEPMSEETVPVESLPNSEKAKLAGKFWDWFHKISDKRFHKLIQEFEATRRFIISYNRKLYVYSIESPNAGIVSIYMLE